MDLIAPAPNFVLLPFQADLICICIHTEMQFNFLWFKAYSSHVYADGCRLGWDRSYGRVSDGVRVTFKGYKARLHVSVAAEGR
jgi:hypothetical protein